MDEGEATQEPTAPEGASAPQNPPSEAEPHAAPGAEDAPAEMVEAASETEADTQTQEADPVATEAEAGAEAPAAEAETAPALDWPHLRGFQAVEPAAEALAGRASFSEDFRLELAARAARFARSVDESIVLSSDGLIRWLGDPIARLVGGDGMLAPRAVLLADEALVGEDRTAVENRVALWIVAHVKKILGPLAALAEGAGLAEDARAVGGKIAEALGVLERERVRNEVKTLDQTARGALRKLGVRFGSLYIYVPALLKPAARGLCTLLWTVRRGSETGADRLLGFAAAGRTSFANEGVLSPDAYRVAGFRLCGERVVRVDIIERLTDLIRAALPDYMRSGTRAPSEAYGFVVTPQMTSLTGCSGEAFSSILRSLGFESVKVSRAAFEAANRKAPTEPVKPVAETTETPPAVAEDAATEPAEAEASAPENEAHEAAAHEESAEPIASTEGGEPSEPETSESAAEAEPPQAEPAEAEPALAHSEEAEPAAETTASHTAEAAAEPAVAEPEQPEAQMAEPEPVDTAAAGSEPTEDAAVSATDAPSVAAVPDLVDEEIEIWRPAPRRPRVAPRPQAGEGANPRFPPRHRRRQHGSPAAEAASTEAKPAETPVAAAEAAAAPAPERDERPRRFERKRNDEHPQRRDDRRPPKDFAPRREPRPTQVDPDSPFAKLAALKPLLERRDKRP